jgi:hypothetical protein
MNYLNLTKGYFMKRLLLAMACSIGIGMAFSASAINNGGCLNGCGVGKGKCLAKASTPQQKDACNTWWSNCTKRCNMHGNK